VGIDLGEALSGFVKKLEDDGILVPCGPGTGRDCGPTAGAVLEGVGAVGGFVVGGPGGAVAGAQVGKAAGDALDAHTINRPQSGGSTFNDPPPSPFPPGIDPAAWTLLMGAGLDDDAGHYLYALAPALSSPHAQDYALDYLAAVSDSSPSDLTMQGDADRFRAVGEVNLTLANVEQFARDHGKLAGAFPSDLQDIVNSMAEELGSLANLDSVAQMYASKKMALQGFNNPEVARKAFGIILGERDIHLAPGAALRAFKATPGLKTNVQKLHLITTPGVLAALGKVHPKASLAKTFSAVNLAHDAGAGRDKARGTAEFVAANDPVMVSALVLQKLRARSQFVAHYAGIGRAQHVKE